MEKQFVQLNHIYKVYPNGVEAVHDFSLDIAKHDFVVIVGPSGCGKSTTLRMVAGLEDISKGELYIDGVFSNAETPKDRNIAMVFQSYSLYPHMTVRENIAFGLKMRKIAEEKMDKNGVLLTKIDTKQMKKIEKEIKSLEKQLEEANASLSNDNNEYCQKQIKDLTKQIQDKKNEIQQLNENPKPVYKYRNIRKDELEEKVNSAAKILELTDYLDRRPSELSGGQRQRVALGRAIVRNAKIFLMDEPLSNLDAKLRASMRSEIIKLHRDLNATIIYVTHDQTEAMTMASKIVVMNHGLIQQIGSPEEIYSSPSNTFVANFIGAPAMNILHANYRKGELIFDENNHIKLENKYIKMHDDFYQQQIAEHTALLNYLNDDVENALYHTFLPLEKMINKPINNNKLMSSLMAQQKEIINGVLNQLEENHHAITGKTADCIAEYQSAFASYRANVKTLLKSNDFDQISEFQLAKDCYQDLLEEDNKRIQKALDIVKSNLLAFQNSDNLVKEIFVRLLKINTDNVKPNKDEIDNLIKDVQDNVVMGGVLSQKVEKCHALANALSNPLHLEHATIKNVYDNALKLDIDDNCLKQTLEMIDTANKSKKVTDLLSNELVLKNLINSLVDAYQSYLQNEHQILFGIRPEDISLDIEENRKKYGDLSFSLELDICELLGKEYIIHSHIGNESLQAELNAETLLKEKEVRSFLFNKNKFSLFDVISLNRINKECTYEK